MQLALLDWALHLAVSPGKRLDLCRLALTQAEQLERYIRNCLASGPRDVCLCVQPPAHDRRFLADEWRLWPFNVLHQSFLLTEQWWEAATRGVWGVAKHHEDVVAFAARQWLDMMSPGNQLATNWQPTRLSCVGRSSSTAPISCAVRSMRSMISSVP